MSGSEAVTVAELTADQIERRLESGETIEEVYMRPRHGLGVMAGGAVMSFAFLLQAWWAYGETGGFAWRRARAHSPRSPSGKYPASERGQGGGSVA